MCGTGGRRADVVQLGFFSERAVSAYLVPALGKSLADGWVRVKEMFLLVYERHIPHRCPETRALMLCRASKPLTG